MSNVLQDLYNTNAGSVWELFEGVSRVPRPSGHEERIRDRLLGMATSNDWDVRQDKTGNVVFAVPGCGSLANEAILVLQRHMDMVCEKNSDCNHDFLTDSIPLYMDGDWVRTRGTSLGADNGIVLALATAVASARMDDRIPLELLFTVEKETGLKGANNLDPAIIKGRRILNLDSEIEGVFIIGCAGSLPMSIRFDKKDAGTNDAPAVKCIISGLRGGHSGIDIHKNRQNAIVTGVRLIRELHRVTPGVIVRSLVGGNKVNAIPRECTFVLADCVQSTTWQPRRKKHWL